MGNPITHFLLGGTYCGSLSVIGPHKLIGSGIIRRYGFAGEGVASLEEVCHYQGGFCGLIYTEASV